MVAKEKEVRGPTSTVSDALGDTYIEIVDVFFIETFFYSAREVPCMVIVQRPEQIINWPGKWRYSAAYPGEK